MTWDIILGVIWGVSLNAAYVLGYVSALHRERVQARKSVRIDI